MLFLGRILDGITAANIYRSRRPTSPIDAAAGSRQGAFGMIGIAFGIGFFFGPAMAGWLSQYGLHVPFLVAACLSAGSMICTYMLLEPAPRAPRSGQPGAAATASGPGGKATRTVRPEDLHEYFRRPGWVRCTCNSLLLHVRVLGVHERLRAVRRAAVRDRRRLRGPRARLALMFAYSWFLGIICRAASSGAWSSGLASQGRARRLVAAIAPYLCSARPRPSPWSSWCRPCSAYGNGVLRPVITSQITQQVGRHEQGVAIGISGSLSSLAMTIHHPPAVS